MTTETPAPSIATSIGERYNDSSYLLANADWHASDAPWKARLILAMLERQGVAPQRLAEVGCGSGEILVQLARSLPDARFVGFDLSRDAYAICKPKENERIRFLLEDATTSDDRFDVLMAIDVFEHIENYFAFLRGIRPLGDWHVFHIPLDIHVNAMLRNGFLKARDAFGHLHHFTAETALATLQDAGYEIVAHEFTPAFDADGQMGGAIRTRLARLPRRLLYRLSPNFLSKSMGGCSLLVLAKRAIRPAES